MNNNSFTKALLPLVMVLGLIGLIGVGGMTFYNNERDIAQGDAVSLCTDLNMIRADRAIGASYATDTLVASYESDLLQLGYTCGSKGLTKVTPIMVDSTMNPTATEPTCKADGKLVLPAVPNAKWERSIGGIWSTARNGAGPAEYHLRLTANDGYVLSTKVEKDVTVKHQLSGKACKGAPTKTPTTKPSSTPTTKPTPTPSDTTYQCRINGLNGGPEYVAFSPDKLGPYNYGPAFTARTVVDARKSIHDQAWCDPVWMVQKSREYVSPGMTAEQANAKVHELIAQAKAGNNRQWDKMVSDILSAFDKAQNSFTTIPAGRYHSLGVLTNTRDGVPRIVDFVVIRSSATPVLQSVVTYPDGSKATLRLRLECDLQLQTPASTTPAGPAIAPTTPEIPRNNEGTPTTAYHKPTPKPVPFVTSTPTPSVSTSKPPATTTPSPTPSVSVVPKDPGKDINANPSIPPSEQVKPTQSAAPDQAQPSAPAPAPSTAYTAPSKPTATPSVTRTAVPSPEPAAPSTQTGSPVGP